MGNGLGLLPPRLISLIPLYSYLFFFLVCAVLVPAGQLSLIPAPACRRQTYDIPTTCEISSVQMYNLQHAVQLLMMNSRSFVLKGKGSILPSCCHPKMIMMLLASWKIDIDISSPTGIENRIFIHVQGLEHGDKELAPPSSLSLSNLKYIPLNFVVPHRSVATSY